MPVTPRVTGAAASSGSLRPLADQCNLSVAGESGALVVPAGAGLVAAPPRRPMLVVTGWAVHVRRAGEQAGGFRDGQRDHPRIGGERLIRAGRWRRLGIGAVVQQGGGDRADRQGGHDQHGVPGDRGVQADLGLAEAEAGAVDLMGT